MKTKLNQERRWLVQKMGYEGWFLVSDGTEEFYNHKIVFRSRMGKYETFDSWMETDSFYQSLK